MKDITIKDIADQLGISHSTVSRALRDHPTVSPATRDKVQAAARQLGYIAHSGARMLSRTQSELLGVVFPDVTNDFYSQVMATLSTSFLKDGFKLVLANSEDHPETEFRQIQSLREARVAGIIIAPTAGILPETIRLLESVPVVQLLRCHPLLRRDAIQVDERAGVAGAVAYLIGKGHTRIGFIGGFGTLSTGQSRAAGYVDALTGRGLVPDNALMQQGPPRPLFGHQAMSKMLALPHPPSAVVVASSELTLGALEAIQQHKIDVPGQLALVAYHDPIWFRLWASGISCIRLPIAAMAHAAAARLLERICGNTEPARLTRALRTELIIRGSTHGCGPAQEKQISCH